MAKKQSDATKRQIARLEKDIERNRRRGRHSMYFMSFMAGGFFWLTFAAFAYSIAKVF